MNKINPLLLSGVAVSLAIFIGRLFGFLREVLIAYVFGESYGADIATLSLMVPDTIANFLLGGAFSSAFMPALLHSSKVKKIKLVYNFQILLGLFFIFFSFLLYLGSEQISFILGEKLSDSDRLKLTNSLALSGWSIPFIVCSAILTAYLNSRDLFFFPALGASVINVFICASLIIYPMLQVDVQYLMAFSIVIGAIMRWGFQFYPIFSIRILLSSFRWDVISSNLVGKEHIKKYVYAFFATAAMVLLPIFSRYFMLQSGEGQLANLSYAQKIADLFVTLISGSVITVLLPRIIKNNDRFIYIKYSLSLIFLFSLLSSFFLNIYSEFISSVLFGRGAFDSSAILSLSKHIDLISYILPFYSCVFFLTGVLAVTDLSSKNTICTVFGLFSFLFCIQVNSGEDVSFENVYFALFFGYFSILFSQILFIFHYERRSNAKSYVYHQQS